MKPLVIDASALLDAITRPDVAEAMVGSHEPCAPALIQWEIAHVVHRTRAKHFGEPKARRALVHHLLAPFRLVDQKDRLDALALLCDEHKLSAYDAAYLQLALDEGAAIVTSDDALRKASAKALGASRAWTIDDIREVNEE